MLVLAGCAHSGRPPLPPEKARPSEHFSQPLPKARLLSPYGKRGRRFHTGLDLQVSRRGGEPILAARDGVVTDYLHTGWWPTFNLADTFLVAGFIVIALLHARPERTTKSPQSADEAHETRT